eukprot:3308127-Prymnesium_polylepis.1
MDRGKLARARADLADALAAAARQQAAASASHEAQLAAARREAEKKYEAFKSKFIREELQPVKPGGVLHFHGVPWERLRAVRVGSTQASARTKRRRSIGMETTREHRSGGKEH